MGVHQRGIFVPHGFGAADEGGTFAFETFEAGASHKRQGFFRRVTHLDNVSAVSLLGVCKDDGFDLLESS